MEAFRKLRRQSMANSTSREYQGFTNNSQSKRDTLLNHRANRFDHSEIDRRETEVSPSEKSDTSINALLDKYDKPSDNQRHVKVTQHNTSSLDKSFNRTKPLFNMDVSVGEKNVSTVSSLIAECKLTNDMLNQAKETIYNVDKSAHQAITSSSPEIVRQMNSYIEKSRSLLAESKDKISILHNKLSMFKDMKGKYYEKMIIKSQYAFQTAKILGLIDILNNIQVFASSNIKKNLRHQMKAANAEINEEEFDDLVAKGQFQRIFQSDAIKSDQLEALTSRTAALEDLMAKMQKLYQLTIIIQTMTNENEDILDEIDDAVDNLNVDVKIGLDNVKEARVYQLSRYKWYLIGFGIVAAIIIITVVAIFA